MTDSLEPKPPEHANHDPAHPVPGCPACKPSTSLSGNEQAAVEADPTAASLHRAVGTAFGVLKILMIALAALFVIGRFHTVVEGEVLLVKRFGEFRDDMVYEKGLIFLWPAPIDEPVVVPAERVLFIELQDAFWPRSGRGQPGASLPEAESLDPALDGYALTGDLNVIHTRWLITYYVRDFFKYRTAAFTWPKSSIDAEADPQGPQAILRQIARAAIVRNLAGMSVDELVFGQIRRQELLDRITDDIRGQLVDPHGRFRYGIDIERVDVKGGSFGGFVPPGRTQEAFNRVTTADQKRSTLIEKARSYQNTTVNEAKVAAARITREAQVYAADIVATAKGDAARMRDILERFPDDPAGLRLYLEGYRYESVRRMLAPARLYYVPRENVYFWTRPPAAAALDTESKSDKANGEELP